MHAFDRQTDRILILDRVCIPCSAVKTSLDGKEVIIGLLYCPMHGLGIRNSEGQQDMISLHL